MSPPATYGDATSEYLALRRGAGVVADAHDLVWVSGADAVSFLDGLISQSVAGLSPGSVARSLLLSPQGKLDVPHHVLRGDDDVGLVTEAGRGEQLATSLGRFKLRVDVEFEGDTRPGFAVWGPEAGRLISTLTGAEAPGAGKWVEENEVLVADLPLIHGQLSRFLVAGLTAEAAVAAGGTAVGSDALGAVRIERGEPSLGSDVDDSTIPEEADLVTGAVDFTKGCYLGQELVARIDSRGRVTKHLRGLTIEENVIPPPAATVEVDGEPVGEVSSVGESLELRAPIALATLRHEVEAGDRVVVSWRGGSTTARVSALPMV